MISFVKRNPLVTFFILAYELSWGSYFILSGAFLFPFGAIIAALIVAGVTCGSAGLKDLLRRCVKWRVGIKWYIAAICVPIFIALATVFLNILLGAKISSNEPLDTWYNVFFLFPVALVDAPLWEETGWRGYEKNNR